MKIIKAKSLLEYFYGNYKKIFAEYLISGLHLVRYGSKSWCEEHPLKYIRDHCLVFHKKMYFKSKEIFIKHFSKQ